MNKLLENMSKNAPSTLIENQLVWVIGIDFARGPSWSRSIEVPSHLTPRGVVGRETCLPTVRPHSSSWKEPKV